MFCSKCGAQLTEDMRNCPKCGAINENYSSRDATDDQNISGKNGVSKAVKLIAVMAVVAVVGVAVIFIAQNRPEKKEQKLEDKILYTPRGLVSYIDEDKAVYFLENDSVFCVEGKVKNARCSPDHLKKVILFNDKKLSLYDSEKNETPIAEKVESIYRISDNACFYSTGSNDHLFVYDFKKMESVDTGVENSSYDFSADGQTVVSVNKKGEMSTYSVGADKPTVLCNIGDDEDTDVICVADDGSNVFWSIKDGSVFSIYMMKNGAPERVGRINNASTYSSVYGYFYNNDKGCLLYSPNSSQMIMYNNDEIKEIALPGVMTYGNMVNSQGMSIDSDDDIVGELYLTVSKKKSSSKLVLYKLSVDGEIIFEAEDIISNFLVNDGYSLRNDCVFYIDSNHDFIMKKLDSEEAGKVITTDVSSIYISPTGRYAYVVKSGGVYWSDLQDKDNRINLITSDYGENDSLYLTDKDDVIYLITNTKDIKDSYSDKGTLQLYHIDGELVEVSEDIMSVYSNDNKYVLADYPVVRKYVSNKDSDFVVDYGTVKEEKYVELITNIKY